MKLHVPITQMFLQSTLIIFSKFIWFLISILTFQTKRILTQTILDFEKVWTHEWTNQAHDFKFWFLRSILRNIFLYDPNLLPYCRGEEQWEYQVSTGSVEVLHLGTSGVRVRRVWCVWCGWRLRAVGSAGLDGRTRWRISRRPNLQPFPGLPLGTQNRTTESETNTADMRAPWWLAALYLIGPSHSMSADWPHKKMKVHFQIHLPNTCQQEGGHLSCVVWTSQCKQMTVGEGEVSPRGRVEERWSEETRTSEEERTGEQSETFNKTERVLHQTGSSESQFDTGTINTPCHVHRRSTFTLLLYFYCIKSQQKWRNTLLQVKEQSDTECETFKTTYGRFGFQ